MSYNLIKIEKTDEFGQVINTAPTTVETPDSEKIITSEIQVGQGEEAIAGSNVKVHYVGTLVDGTQFDSSRETNTPLEFSVGDGKVLKGFDQGVTGMKVGGIRKVVIPPSLGYGQEAVGNIPANSTLTFEIELLEIIK